MIASVSKSDNNNQPQNPCLQNSDGGDDYCPCLTWGGCGGGQWGKPKWQMERSRSASGRTLLPCRTLRQLDTSTLRRQVGSVARQRIKRATASVHGRQSRRSSGRVLTLHAYALRWLLRWKPRSWGAEQSVALGVANAGLTARRQSAPQRWQPRIWRSRTRLRQIPPVSLCETPDIYAYWLSSQGHSLTSTRTHTRNGSGHNFCFSDGLCVDDW